METTNNMPNNLITSSPHTEDNSLLLVRWQTNARTSPEMHRELEEISP